MYAQGTLTDHLTSQLSPEPAASSVFIPSIAAPQNGIMTISLGTSITEKASPQSNSVPTHLIKAKQSEAEALTGGLARRLSTPKRMLNHECNIETRADREIRNRKTAKSETKPAFLGDKPWSSLECYFRKVGTARWWQNKAGWKSGKGVRNVDDWELCQDASFPRVKR